MHPLMID